MPASATPVTTSCGPCLPRSVLSEAEVVLPAGERLATEASIGDLAHQRQ